MDTRAAIVGGALSGNGKANFNKKHNFCGKFGKALDPGVSGVQFFLERSGLSYKEF